MTETPKTRLSRREILTMLAAVGVTGSLPAPAQDAAKINPRSYKVLFENSRVRVLEYLGKPGLGVCGQGRHYHPEHLTIAASGGKMKIAGEDGKVQVHDVPPGSVFFAPAEVHEIENIGGRNVHAYLIEFKDKGWKPSTG
jgi:quercetin dioxygenase-like cupin family protein